jgi:hypothetical protein
VGTVRWDALFRDLEARLEAGEAAELAAEVEERTRIEAAKLRLVDRLHAAVGSELTVVTVGGGAISGTLDAVGAGWLLVRAGTSDVVVAAPAVLTVSGLTAASRDPGQERPSEVRLTLAHALRGLARSRTGVAAVLVDGRVVHGTVERVGADFVEISEHAPGEARRQVSAVRAVPVNALAAVRST